MALVPPWMLDAVVAIGFPEPEKPTRWAATGFLYGRYLAPSPEEGKSLYRVFLVTNRHVFQNERVAQLRFNPTLSEPAKEYSLTLSDEAGNIHWTGHPNPRIDVAVCPIDAARLRADGIQFQYFQDNQTVIMRRQEALEAGLHEGDGAFILGFPMGLVGEERNYAIVRGGTLARVRDCLSGASDEFLVDAAVFPGNSGGPVILRVNVSFIEGTKAIRTAAMIGIVKSYVPYRDVAVSTQTGMTRVVFEENSGLAAAHPIDHVEEAVTLAVERSSAQTSPPPSAEEPHPEPQAEPLDRN